MIYTKFPDSFIGITAVCSLTSRTTFFCTSLTFPARQQWAMALMMIGLLDLELGSLKSLGPIAYEPNRKDQ